MNLPIVFRPEARGVRRSLRLVRRLACGTGELFAEQFQQVLDRIAATPQIHAAVLGSVRKAVVVRFPYCVFYREEVSCVRVLSVFHTSRDPRIWQSRA